MNDVHLRFLEMVSYEFEASSRLPHYTDDELALFTHVSNLLGRTSIDNLTFKDLDINRNESHIPILEELERRNFNEIFGFVEAGRVVVPSRNQPLLFGPIINQLEEGSICQDEGVALYKQTEIFKVISRYRYRRYPK